MNLRQLGQGLMLYAGDHQKHLPDTLEDLMRDYDITAEFYICPSSSDEKAPGANAEQRIANMRARGLPTQLSSATTQPSRYCSYIYAGKGLTSDQLTPKTILVYEPLANHDNDGINILFGDGHVDFVARDKAIERIAAMIRNGGGINPATTRPATTRIDPKPQATQP